MSYLYRLDSEDENQDWVKYEGATIIVNTGRHKLIAGEGAIRFREDITLTAHTKRRLTETLPARTAYEVCGWAFFTQYDRSSGLRCSPVVKVSNAEHNLYVPLMRRYDINNNGVIDTNEMLSATSDYFADLIPTDEMLVLICVYFSS